MKKILLLLALLIWAGCSDDSGSSVNANGCHEEKVTYDDVCGMNYNASACYQVETAMQLKGETSITIEVCDNSDGFY